MSVVRRFLVAPALVRLIRKERGGGRITEGYFAAQAGRTSLVRVEGQVCHLILVAGGAEGGAEERTEVPRAHGDALLDVCPGKAAYDRTSVTLAGREVLVDRYVSPGALDLVSVSFDSEGEAKGFSAPAWFGREVSGEPAYERQALAVQGPPKGAPEVPLSNAALDAVLDLTEPRFSFNRFPAAAGAEEPGRRAPQPPAAPAARPVQETPRAEAGKAEAPRIDPPGEAARPQPAPSQPAPPPAPTPRRPEEPSVAQSMATASAVPEAAPPGDARIEDVIESLSQALGAAIQQPPQGGAQGASQGGDEDPTASFERWTPRPRRTQPT